MNKSKKSNVLIISFLTLIFIMIPILTPLAENNVIFLILATVSWGSLFLIRFIK